MTVSFDRVTVTRISHSFSCAASVPKGMPRRDNARRTPGHRIGTIPFFKTNKPIGKTIDRTSYRLRYIREREQQKIYSTMVSLRFNSCSLALYQPTPETSPTAREAPPSRWDFVLLMYKRISFFDNTTRS